MNGSPGAPAHGGNSGRGVGVAVLLAFVVLALLIRLPALQGRPLHTDEAVHMVKAGILLETGSYAYDAHEYHGPTLYYFSLPFLWLSGARTFSQIPSALPFLIVPVLFGIGLVALIPLVRDGIGRQAAAWAALMTAVSPAMVFYSRYYIQEIPLVFFTFLLVAGVWRYLCRPSHGWAMLSGVAAGMMFASKETWVIPVACAAAAATLTHFWDHFDRRRPSLFALHPHALHLVAGSVVCLLVAVTFLTGIFTNMKAFESIWQAYGTYLDRGHTGDSSTSGMSLHVHPWHFYLHRLLFFHQARGPWWSEALIVLLAVVGFVWTLRGRFPAGGHPAMLRFLSIFAVLQTIVYSAIPYKTPWNALGFLQPMILLGGFGASVLVECARPRWLKAAVVTILLAGVAQLGAQAWRTTHRFCADTRNPWVYAGTSADLLNLAGRMEKLAEADPAHYAAPVQVIVPGSDYWPLPWYLRRFENAGYYADVPDQLDAPVIIAAASLKDKIAPLLKEDYYQDFAGLRPGVLLNVYVRRPLWDQFVKAQEGK